MDKKDHIIANLRQTVEVQKLMLDKADEIEKTYEELVTILKSSMSSMEDVINKLVDELARFGVIYPKLNVGKKKE